MSRTASGHAADTSILSPWDRAHGEPPPAFAAFVMYRDMGSERTLKKVAAALGRKYQATRALAARWQWTARALEYDRWADRKAQEAYAARRAEAIERHARIGRLLQGKALEAAGSLDKTKVSASGVARMAAEGVKIERLALGESTENVSQESEFKGLGDALRSMRERAEAEEESGESSE